MRFKPDVVRQHKDWWRNKVRKSNVRWRYLVAVVNEGPEGGAGDGADVVGAVLGGVQQEGNELL